MSTKKQRRDLLVFAHWAGLEAPCLIGTLHAEMLRGKEIFSFKYDNQWLQSRYAQLLDPDLRLYSGIQYPNEEKGNFGLFLDSAPDRWGRVLMKRREAAMARLEKRPEQTLFETDYLLGLYDGHRMGALRFKLEPDGPFLNNNAALAAPPWTSIRELEKISLEIEKDNVVDNPDYLKWLNVLIAPGSSLGGARPKASVLDKKNGLWIAKFPSRHDDGNIGGWEIVAHELAKAAGLHVAEAMAQKFSGKYYTYLTRRFDRTPRGERIHFASAMTMLGHTDGQDHQEGISYLELVDFLSNHGANISKDLEELWRRIVFNICVSNTDDHLRNHGFILTSQGWVLSPAYDMNPAATGTGLKLNISENDNALDIDLAMEVAPFFRLTEKKATDVAKKVKRAVANWKAISTHYGIAKMEQDAMRSAFSRA